MFGNRSIGKNCLSIDLSTPIYQIRSTKKCVVDDDDYDYDDNDDDDNDDDDDDDDDLLVQVEVQTIPPLIRPAALPAA